MRLLFDENLSRRLVDLLAREFPGSSHPDLLDLRGSPDTAVWQHAREHNFTIVSKDNGFRQRPAEHRCVGEWSRLRAVDHDPGPADTSCCLFRGAARHSPVARRVDPPAPLLHC